jgi:hypothetical protein
MSESSPIEKPEPTPYERMQALASKVMAVPKSEVDKREQEWRENRQTTRQKKNPN